MIPTCSQRGWTVGTATELMGRRH